MRDRLWIALFFLSPLFLQAQQIIQIELSKKQTDRIEEKSSAARKLKLYHRYFYRDSIKHVRQLEKLWKKQSDSLYYSLNATTRKAQKRLEKNSSKANRGISDRRNVVKQKSKGNNILDSVSSKIPNAPALSLSIPDIPVEDKIPLELNGIDNITGQAGDALKNHKIVQEGAQITNEVNRYVDQLHTYSELVQNTDTLKQVARQRGETMLKEQAGQIEGMPELNELSTQMGEADKLKGLAGDYKSQVEMYTDSAYLKEQAQKKAEELAMQYIEEHPEVMKEVQRKMNLLMKKYSVVPNSNDLSTAIKRTSLKGKTFRERLVIAANFQTISLDPVSIDFSPTIGYKFNSRFLLGLGGTYRQTFSTDSLPTLAPEVWGYKAFTSYDVIGTFFAYGEYDRNTSGVSITENNSNRIWNQALLAGVGRKFAVHRKIDMTLVFAYNFLHEPNDPVYPRPWVIRVGFQTSELAMMKKRPFGLR